MQEEKQHYLILSVLLWFNSALLLARFLPNLVLWNPGSETFLIDLLGLIWPIMGISASIEFLLADKWGWGGLLFHFFVLYCGIYYLVLIIQAILAPIASWAHVISIIMDVAISTVGWLSFLYYYD